MLTDMTRRNASRPERRARNRLADVDGLYLYLELAPTGPRRWCVDYQNSRKERCLALGSDPDVSLTSARQAPDEARRVGESEAEPVRALTAEKLAKTASTATLLEAVAR